MFDAYVSYWARQKPHALAITTLVTSVTYQQFDRDIDRVVTALAEIAPPAAGLVGVQLANHYLHWLVLMALSRMGVVSASIPAAGPSASDVLAVLQPHLLLTDTPAEAACRVVGISADWIARTLRAPAVAAERRRYDPNAIGRIATSSGTTGTRKAIPYSWDTIVERARRRACLDMAGSDTVLVTIGLDANYGFGQRVAAWIVGASVAMGPELERLPAALPTLRPTVLVMSSGHLQALIAALPADFRPMPGLRLRVGGSSVPRSLAREARLRLSSDVIVGYSSSEAGIVARGPAALLDEHPGAVGYRLPWADIEAIDAEGRPCPAGVAGELRVRSADMVAGYHDDDAQTRKSFRDGWFYPGDIGTIMADGAIRIDGRNDDVINLNGWKLLPSAIEDVVQACPGVLDAAAFSLRGSAGIEAPWVAIVRSDRFEWTELSGRLHDRLPNLPALQTVWLDKIPRNSVGKVDRKLLRRSAAAMAVPAA